jgi:NADH-quinone oxidoreductase subunit M
MANSGFPLTSGFIAEFIALSGIFNTNPFIALIGSISIVLVPSFMLNLLHRICYGRYSSYITIVTSDITIKEFHLFIPLIFFTLFLGISPQILFDSCFFNVTNLLFEPIPTAHTRPCGMEHNINIALRISVLTLHKVVTHSPCA